ncbi:hypothetical protein [Geodermatophilus sp. DSM 44513]|uniref:hypothetical protein n=1 Tax=Geodermatophilus sp. DSM 44513 TaxID=1528104 RepID=UPI0012877351|nr:hypothetical protein [Geodermatophilus sp. DSM 44513]WNV77206.1 hypothetical protein RTG05_08020 [Geodermatophilus sp. DSM 44513]
MTPEHRHERIEAARVRAELTVSELWLRYLSLGGNGDLFDLDGYLNGLLPLTSLNQNVLAVAVNEGLDEVYRAARVPLSTPAPDGALHDAIAALLDSAATCRSEQRPNPHDTTRPPDPPTAPPASHTPADE